MVSILTDSTGTGNLRVIPVTVSVVGRPELLKSCWRDGNSHFSLIRPLMAGGNPDIQTVRVWCGDSKPWRGFCTISPSETDGRTICYFDGSVVARRINGTISLSGKAAGYDNQNATSRWHGAASRS